MAVAEAAPASIEVRIEVRPAWPFRLRGGSPDGLFRRRGSCVQRLLHIDGSPVMVGAVQAAPDRVLFGARADDRWLAEAGIERMRWLCGVDDDLREFHDRFRRDPWIGRSVTKLPHVRVFRRPAWEALAWAVTEQLIEYDRAVRIQRRMIAALGYRCPATGLRDAPSAVAVLGEAPARLQSWDLAAARALALRKCASEVASGRVDLERSHEAGWRRLLAISGIGPWTVEMLAVYGQGRYDQVPAGDLGYLEIVGRVLTGDPQAHSSIEESRAFFERYGEWKALAAEHLRAMASFGWLAETPLASV